MALYAVWVNDFKTGFVAVEAATPHAAVLEAGNKASLYRETNTEWSPNPVFAIPYETALQAIDYAGNSFLIPMIDDAFSLSEAYAPSIF